MTAALEATPRGRRALRPIGLAGGLAIAVTPAIFVPVSLTRLDFVWATDARMLSLANYAAIYAVVAYGLAMLMRFAGLASVVHGALWGVGAYTAAILADRFGWGFWSSLPFAAILPAIVAVLVGLPSLRTSGLAFIIVTLSLCEFLVLVGTNWEGLTNGPQGMTIFDPPGPLGPIVFTSPVARYYLALGFLYMTVTLVWLISRSAFGRRLIAIRDNELLARSLGLNTFVYKLAIFTASAAVVGVAGQLYLYHQQAIQPDLFGSVPFINVLLMVVMGGTHVLPGPAVGAWLVQFLPELLAPIGLRDANIQRLAYGVLLVAFMIAAPEGIAGALKRAWSRLQSYVSQPQGTPARATAESLSPLFDARQGRANLGDEVVLQATDLRKQFGALRAIDGVNFSVKRGEVLGIIGPNGSGKTTLFNCVSGLLRLNSGSVRLRGEEIGRNIMDAIARRGLVRTFQQEMTFPSQTVRGNIQLALDILTSYGQRETAPLAIPRDADGLLSFCGLMHVADTPVRMLSYGHARLLGVAMALATSPHIIMLDEPAAGLNHLEGARLANVLLRACNAGATLVVIDHDMAFLLPICDRILVMDAGVPICEGRPAEIQNDPRVIEVYLGSGFGAGLAGPPSETRWTGPVPADRTDSRAARQLEIRNLTVGYGPGIAVHDLSLTVGAGEAVALLGANGAGKSTTLRAISGLLKPWSGEIFWGEDDLVGRGPADILRAGIAHVPEGRMLFMQQTVEENLLLGQLTRRDRARAREDMDHLLDVFPVLKPKFKQAAGQLSGGQQQMLAIARGLMSNPRLLLLDEPSLGLSPVLVEEVTELIGRLRAERQMGLLLVEQNPMTAVRLTERVYVLQNGRLRSELMSKDILGNMALLDTYLGKQNTDGVLATQ